MKTIAPDFRHFLLRASFLLGLAACSDPDETSPPATTGTDSTSTGGTSSDSTATTSTNSGSTTSNGDSSNSDTTSNSGDCVGENGCFSCPPTTSKHLTNACTDAQCQPFPITKERLPLLNDDGSLPPLP